MIEACRARFPDTPMVAAFDSAFHSTMPEHAWTYAIARQLAEKEGIRRYGFHGFAHHSMLAAYTRMSAVTEGQANIVTLQLGGGCSAAAIRGGISIDTSMGLTPLEGIPMATRSGDIDVGIALALQRSGMSLDEVERLLNERSGLLGMAGTADVQQLLHAETLGDGVAAAALSTFCYRAAKYIGAYHVAVGGAQAVVFGGGIGENSPEMRARICGWLEPLGLTINKQRNDDLQSKGEISDSDSAFKAYVACVDEEYWIARDVLDVIGARYG
jgi:acetate kinase